MNNESPLLIAQMPAEQRPREKALRDGIKSLSDAELMAIIFGTGIKGKSVVQLCAEILGQYDGHLSQITAMDAHEFMSRHRGIGPAKALTLIAALELGVRAAHDAAAISQRAMTTSQAAYDYMNRFMSELDHEEFWVLLLRRNLKPLRHFMAGRGNAAQTTVDIRHIVREALISKASAMILFHNHPSGALNPSSADIDLTNRISQAARYFDIRVLDHIVVGAPGYFSFNDEGKMPS